jgi:GT2 family glycosyltransferase
MYLEDVDIAARATVMGWDNYVVPGARAYHMGSASSGKNPGFSLYMTFRNNTAVLIKNLPLIILIRMWPKLVRGDIDTIKVLWRSDKKPAIKKVIWGRVAGTLRAPLYLWKRYKVYRHRNVSYKSLWSLMFKGF